MATNKIIFNAPALAQVTAYVFAGTWGTSDTITVTINGKAVTITTGSATIATFLATLVTALNASTIPEFTEITWGGTSPSLTGTCDTAGVPFTATITKTSTSGTIDGGASSTGTDSTANSGRSNLTNTTNWSAGSLAANSDTIVVENNDQPISCGLNQSGITSVTINVEPNYSGEIGLPETNATGFYTEYRGTYLRYGISVLNYAGTSGRAKFDCGSTSATVNINNTGSTSETGLEALLLKGSAIATLNVNKGSVAVAAFDTETSTITTANVGFVTSPTSDSTVRFGRGCTMTTLNMSGGVVQTNKAVTTINNKGGILTHNVGNITTLNNLLLAVAGSNLTPTVVIGNGAFTIGTYNGAEGSLIDLSQGQGVVTFTNCNLYNGAQIYDPGGRAVFTNPYATINCGLEDVIVATGKNLTVAITRV